MVKNLAKAKKKHGCLLWAAEESGAVSWHGSGGLKIAQESIRVYEREGKYLVTDYQEACPSCIKTDLTGNTASEISKAT